MVRARVAGSLATLVLIVATALGTAGCLLVPAPVPVAGPVVVAPRPYGHYHRGYYGHGHGGHRHRGHWR